MGLRRSVGVGWFLSSAGAVRALPPGAGEGEDAALLQEQPPPRLDLLLGPLGPLLLPPPARTAEGRAPRLLLLVRGVGVEQRAQAVVEIQWDRIAAILLKLAQKFD